MIKEFKPKHRYRHKNFLDVDMSINYIFADRPNEIEMHVCFYNQRTNILHDCGEVKVKKVDYERWTELNSN